MASWDHSDGEAAQVAVLEAPAMGPALVQLLRPLRLRLNDWKHLRTHHRPGAGASGVYELQARARDGAVLTLCAIATTAAPVGPAVSTMLVSGTRLRLWLHPRDPVLPGLAWATNAADVGERLFDGIRPELAMAGYRPMRRAVLQARVPGWGLYLKVLQPPAARRLHRRHVLLADAGLPVPATTETGAPGVLALETLHGAPLVRPLINGSAAGFDPMDLPRLLDRLPAQLLELPTRHTWTDRILDYARAAAVVLPHEAARIQDLAHDIRSTAARADAGPAVPVHGDFHPGNLLVSGPPAVAPDTVTPGTVAPSTVAPDVLTSSGRGQERQAGPAQLHVTGLLDLDNAGPGRRVDDLACFVGHAAVIAAVNPHRPEAAAQLDRFHAAYGSLVDPQALAARAAAVALTLVAGARERSFRSRREEALLRLRAAEALLESAGGS